MDSARGRACHAGRRSSGCPLPHRMTTEGVGMANRFQGYGRQGSKLVFLAMGWRFKAELLGRRERVKCYTEGGLPCREQASEEVVPFKRA